MNSRIDIGEIIRLEFEKSGWSVAHFAKQIRKDRTVAYHIFKRKIIDTSLLYDISMALNTDFFQYYSNSLMQNNKTIGLKKEKITEPSIPPKKKVLVEFEMTEEEYARFLREHLHIKLSDDSETDEG